MSDWISVEDRLPEEDQEVLVWVEDHYYHAMRQDYGWTDAGYEYRSIPTPSHWMPMPEPPKD